MGSIFTGALRSEKLRESIVVSLSIPTAHSFPQPVGFAVRRDIAVRRGGGCAPRQGNARRVLCAKAGRRTFKSHTRMHTKVHLE